MRHVSGFTGLTCLFVSAQALAGAVLQTETREYHVDPPAVGSTEMFTDGSSLRIEINSISSGESGVMIFHGDRNEMIVTDDERREYYVIGEETLNAMAGQVSQAMKEMQAMLESMPPEQRAMAEQMMKQQMPGMQPPQEEPSTIRKTGKSDTINGYDCEFHEVSNRGRTTREMCVAKWGDIEGGADAADALIAMGKFFESMHEAFSSGAGVDLMGRQDEIFAHIRELGGFPVYSKDYDETGAVTGESSLISSRSDAIDAAMFEPPEGYRRAEMY
jgi:hypothetical protein